MITSQQAWSRILKTKGKIFRVVFRTKTPQYARNPDGSRGLMIAPAGRVRTMVARLGVQKFTKGVIPPEVRRAEDLQHDVLTCFDVQVFNALRTHFEDEGVERGLAIFMAGRRSYRRINMNEVLQIQGA